MVDKFLEYLKYEKRYSPHTVIAYENDLVQAEEYFQSTYEVKMLEVNHVIIRSWVVEMMELGITERSVNRKISSLKAFFKFLKSNDVVKVNPMLKIQSLKVEKRLPVYVKERDMSSVLEQLQFGDDFCGVRDSLLIELFYVTGMRLSELINLKESDIASDSVKVLGKRNKERIIPLAKNTMARIKTYLEFKKNTFSDSVSFLLVTDQGKKLYEKFVYRKVNYYLGLATSLSKKSPHVLRHTFATHMLNKGVELNAIKEILGHANLAATQVYTHNSIEELKNIYKQAHPRS